jgi:biotin-(acetyl-CoA carboxylase) ligase
MRGRPVHVVELGGSEMRGIALGIDFQGALRVRDERGETRRVIAGDVTLAKEADPR